MGLLAVMFQHFVLYRGMSDMLDFILTAAFSFTHSCAEIRNDVNLFFKGHKFIDSAHLLQSFEWCTGSRYWLCTSTMDLRTLVHWSNRDQTAIKGENRNHCTYKSLMLKEKLGGLMIDINIQMVLIMKALFKIILCHLSINDICRVFF